MSYLAIQVAAAPVSRTSLTRSIPDLLPPPVVRKRGVHFCCTWNYSGPRAAVESGVTPRWGNQAGMSDYMYRSAYERRRLSREALKGQQVRFRVRGSGGQTLYEGEAHAALCDEELALLAEQVLGDRAQIWQVRDRQLAARALNDPFLPVFPDDYHLTAEVDIHDPEAIFTLTQHRPLTAEEERSGDFPGWHERPGVLARRGVQPASLSVGDVVVVRVPESQVHDLLGRPRQALRVLGLGWEQLEAALTVTLTEEAPHSPLRLHFGPGRHLDLDFPALRALRDFLLQEEDPRDPSPPLSPPRGGRPGPPACAPASAWSGPRAGRGKAGA